MVARSKTHCNTGHQAVLINFYLALYFRYCGCDGGSYLSFSTLSFVFVTLSEMIVGGENCRFLYKSC